MRLDLLPNNFLPKTRSFGKNRKKISQLSRAKHQNLFFIFCSKDHHFGRSLDRRILPGRAVGPQIFRQNRADGIGGDAQIGKAPGAGRHHPPAGGGVRRHPGTRSVRQEMGADRRSRPPGSGRRRIFTLFPEGRRRTASGRADAR